MLDAYSKHLPVPDRDPAPLKMGSYFVSAIIQYYTILAFRPAEYTHDGKMSKMFRGRRGRDGLPHLPLLLVTEHQHSEEGVGHGKLVDAGHGPAAQPVRKSELATLG